MTGAGAASAMGPLLGEEVGIAAGTRGAVAWLRARMGRATKPTRPRNGGESVH